MRAVAGDRLLIKQPRLHAPLRDGQVLEVQGEDGSPPYLVRWSDDGCLGLIFPGPEARVRHLTDVREGRTSGAVMSGKTADEDVCKVSGTVLVGIDGSGSSRQALGWAAGQARLTSRCLVAITTWEWPESYTDCLLLGFVSHFLATHALCPVVIVRQGDANV